jgi:hypothetical protein
MTTNNQERVRPSTPDAARNGRGETLSNLEWTVSESLVLANRETNRALEAYLLMLYRDDGAVDPAEFEQSVANAKHAHEEALEQLELIEEQFDDDQ